MIQCLHYMPYSPDQHALTVTCPNPPISLHTQPVQTLISLPQEAHIPPQTIALRYLSHIHVYIKLYGIYPPTPQAKFPIAAITLLHTMPIKLHSQLFPIAAHMTCGPPARRLYPRPPAHLPPAPNHSTQCIPPPPPSLIPFTYTTAPILYTGTHQYRNPLIYLF